jgi:hypothetical protein
MFVKLAPGLMMNIVEDLESAVKLRPGAGSQRIML